MRRHLSMLIALCGALALALPLGACGRKGALDPPPGGYQLQGGSVRTPVTRRGRVPEQDGKPEKQEYDQDGRPILPEGQNRRLPADWLLD